MLLAAWFSMLFRHLSAQPPHADAEDRSQHQNDTAQRDGGDNAEHNESADREHAYDDDNYIGDRVSGGDLPVWRLMIQLFLTNLLFNIGLSIEAFEPWRPGSAIFIILLEKLAHSTVLKQCP